MHITLGVEEELQVVDATTFDLAAHNHDLTELTCPPRQGGTDREIHRGTIELKTAICRTPSEVALQIAELRGLAASRAASQSQRVLAAGLHPFADWRRQLLHDDAQRYPHYAQLLHEYQDVARGAMSFGLHVHLGLPDDSLRMPVMNRLRDVLPLVLALSANAPFCEGRDTGLHTWRHSLLGRYPRMGIPDAWDDEQAYFAHIERLRSVGSIGPDASLWEDLRLHHRYGTLEVRVCDAHHRLERLWLIVALLQAEALTLAKESLAGQARPLVARTCIEENKWRVRRHGLTATLVDWQHDEELPVATVLQRWLRRLEPAGEELGLTCRLEQGLTLALEQGTGADEQRRWLAEHGSAPAVVRALIDATALSEPVAA